MSNVLSRREFAAPFAMGGAAQISRAAQKGTRPKNILWLMTDQHRPGALGIDGSALAKTPALDGLARTGVRFDNAYCTNPVCVPSRASLLTGLYTHNHRAWNNGTPWPFEVKTIAHHLGKAGYMSGLIGKMHFVDAQTHGFDYRLDFNDWMQYLGPKTKLFADELGKRNSGSGLPQINDLWRDFDDPWISARENDGRKGLVPVGRISKLEERDHFESFVTRESVRFLKDHGKQQPFFLIASYLKPHDPFMPSKRFADMFRPEDMKIPDTWGKVNLSSIPKEIRESIENDWISPELLKNPDNVRQRIALYYANLAQADDAIGAMLRALNESGLADDTIVIYTTDHGEMLGEHGLWQKMVFYEPSVRVPLIFRVPGMRHQGQRCRNLVSQAGVMPTLLELCGVPAPAADFPSLVPDLNEPVHLRERTVYSEYALNSPRAKYMVREGRFKFNFYVNDMAELYDLGSDPAEMNNLAGSGSHQQVQQQMMQRLMSWYRPPEMGKQAPANTRN